MAEAGRRGTKLTAAHNDLPDGSSYMTEAGRRGTKLTAALNDLPDGSSYMADLPGTTDISS